MILSDREIQAAIQRGAVFITPTPPTIDAPMPAGKKSPWSSTTLDLRLHSELTVWEAKKIGANVTFEYPDHPDFDFNSLLSTYATRRVIADGDVHILNRGDFVLGWTLEEVRLPTTSRVAARVEGKSSLARLGIGVHVTAPTIHAGFGVDPKNPNYPGSRIQLEIFHHGLFPVKLKPGMLICQLVFEEVHGTPVKGYEERGRFSVQGAQPLPK